MGPNCNNYLDVSFLNFFIYSCSSEYCSTMPCYCVSLLCSLKFSCPHHRFTCFSFTWQYLGPCQEILHIIGRQSVNAQALTLENSLDAVVMDMSNSGCVSQKGSRQMQREEHANKCWKAAGCQMRACRAWCLKSAGICYFILISCVLNVFLKLWWHWRW